MSGLITIIPATIKSLFSVLVTCTISISIWLVFQLSKINKRYKAFIKYEIAAWEKESIANSIYDDWGPVLSGIKLQYAQTVKHLPQSPPAAIGINQHLDDVIISMRHTAASLAPTALAIVGLAPAIINLVRKIHIKNLQAVSISQSLPKMPYALSLAIYRVVENLLLPKGIPASSCNTSFAVFAKGSNVHINIEKIKSKQSQLNKELIHKNLLNMLQIRVAILQGSLIITEFNYFTNTCYASSSIKKN